MYKSVSYLAGQVSIVAAKYGSIVVYISKVRNGNVCCLVRLLIALFGFFSSRFDEAIRDWRKRLK